MKPLLGLMTIPLSFMSDYYRQSSWGVLFEKRTGNFYERLKFAPLSSTKTYFEFKG
jgi:hypothetical protein